MGGIVASLPACRTASLTVTHQNDLELLRHQIFRRHRPQGRALVYPVGEHDRPEQLEKILSSIEVCAELDCKEVVRDLLQMSVSCEAGGAEVTSPSAVQDRRNM